MIQHDQPLRPGIVELVSHLFGAEQGVKRHHHRAQAQSGVISHHELGAVGEKDGQAVARGEPLVLEGPGQPGRLVRQLLVSEDPAEENQGRGLGSLRRGLEQQGGQWGRGRSHGVRHVRVVMRRPGQGHGRWASH